MLRQSPYNLVAGWPCGPNLIYSLLFRVFALYTSSSMVRLITHNLLACHAKGCTSNNFPLAFKDVQIALRDAEFNADFLRNFMPKIEWNALVQASRQVRAPRLLRVIVLTSTRLFRSVSMNV